MLCLTQQIRSDIARVRCLICQDNDLTGSGD